jgi:hypothetical protein
MHKRACQGFVATPLISDSSSTEPMENVVPPIIYLDTCVVSDLATNNLKLAEVFDKCACSQAIFAFTAHSIFEAIQGDLPARIAARALVIDNLANMWLANPVDQRELQIARFLKPNFCPQLQTELRFPSLGTLMQFDLGAQRVTHPERYSASYFACHKMRGKSEKSPIETWFKFGEKVRQTLTAIKPDILDFEVNLILARRVIARYGLAETDDDAMQMIAKIGAASSDLLAECPSIEIERLLSEFRTSGALKKKPSNTYDFFHVWAALSGCNFFVHQTRALLRRSNM